MPFIVALYDSALFFVSRTYVRRVSMSAYQALRLSLLPTSSSRVMASGRTAHISMGNPPGIASFHGPSGPRFDRAQRLVPMTFDLAQRRPTASFGSLPHPGATAPSARTATAVNSILLWFIISSEGWSTWQAARPLLAGRTECRSEAGDSARDVGSFAFEASHAPGAARGVSA